MQHSFLPFSEIFAYPTESVFGLGCDPFNEQAVQKILRLKRRHVEKGLLLIASHWDQIKNLVNPLPEVRMQAVQKTWPGPVTWIFPASEKVPAWIRGKHQTVALRVTSHPIAKALCDEFGGPLVSTSANIEGQKPARTAAEVKANFPSISIIKGEVGKLAQPTSIIDAQTGVFHRGS